MKITFLVENSLCENECKNEHGLSLVLQNDQYSILFDMGETDLFARNAKERGIDLSNIQMAILSHAHHDHSGGLKTFLELNKTAPVYLQAGCVRECFSLHEDGHMDSIGLDKDIPLNSSRLIYLRGDSVIAPDLQIISGLDASDSPFQNHLLQHDDGGDVFVPDMFDHEQSLLITEGEKHILISGCSHCGIEKILARATELAGKEIDIVIGGFHLPWKKSEDVNMPTLDAVIEKLDQYKNTQFWTGHCTGSPAYNILKSHLGSRLSWIKDYA